MVTNMRKRAFTGNSKQWVFVGIATLFLLAAIVSVFKSGIYINPLVGTWKHKQEPQLMGRWKLDCPDAVEPITEMFYFEFQEGKFLRDKFEHNKHKYLKADMEVFSKTKVNGVGTVYRVFLSNPKFINQAPGKTGDQAAFFTIRSDGRLTPGEDGKPISMDGNCYFIKDGS